MRTDRRLTTSRLRGICPLHADPNSVNRMTQACENITLPASLRYAVGNNNKICLFFKDVDRGLSWTTVSLRDEAALLGTFESDIPYLVILYGHDNSDEYTSYGILGGVGREDHSQET